MSEENGCEVMETIDEIVREMRTLGRLDEKSTDKIPRSLQALGLRTYADRIEAAAKRERESTCEKSSAVGNAAAMREALSDSCYAMFNFLKTQNGGYVEMANALDKAKAALAKPPRNCDSCNTVDDAVSRAIHLGVVDCGFGAREMAEFLLAEAK